MRLLRLLGLVATMVAVYFAQSIFEHHSLGQLLPAWLLNSYPALYRYTRWLPSDLFEVALWLVALAMLCFGLLTPPWRGPVQEQTSHRVFTTRQPRVFVLIQWMGIICSGLALISAGVTLLYLWRAGSDNLPVQLAWVGAMLLYLLGTMPRPAKQVMHTPRLAQNNAPPDTPVSTALISSWRNRMTLGLIFAGALLFWSWPLRSIPIPVDEVLSQIGLRAFSLAQGKTIQLFTSEANPISPLMLAPTALAIRLVSNPLLAFRVTGLLAMLLTIGGTWLLGHELFRRSLALGYFGEVLEDEGQWLTLLATGFIAMSSAILYYGRLPIYLEPVGWGCLSAWALLRARRTGDRLAYALSGVLGGWTALLYPSGWTFLLMLLAWWIGMWLLPRRRAQANQEMRRVTSPSAPRGHSWLAFLIWLGGIFVAMAPQIGLWVRQPALFWAHVPSSVGQQFAALLTPASQDLVGWLTLPLFIPLVLLALAALLFNADRLPGLLLLLWLGSGLMIGAHLLGEQSRAATMPTTTQQIAFFLPLAPAVALTLAFVLDRIRLTLLATLGTWVLQATTYTAIGLVLWTGFVNGVMVYQNIQTSNPPASYIGYAIQALPASQAAVLWIDPSVSEIQWQEPVIAFLTAHSPSGHHQLSITADQWLPTLPPQTQVFIPPSQPADAALVASHYPGGTLFTQRDLRGNPIFYRYVLP